MLTFGDVVRRFFSFIGMNLVFGAILFTASSVLAGYIAAGEYTPGTPAAVAGLWGMTTFFLDYGALLAGFVTAISAIGSFGRQRQSLLFSLLLGAAGWYCAHVTLTHPATISTTRTWVENTMQSRGIEPEIVKVVALKRYPQMADPTSTFRKKYEVVVKRLEAEIQPGLRQPLLVLWACRETERELAR